MNGSMVPAGKWCLCLRPWLGASPLQLPSPLETAGPNTFPFCNLFLFPRLLPPLTGHSVTYALTLNSPGPSPKRLLSESGSMCSEVQTVSPLHFLSTFALGPIPFLFNQLCPLPIQPSLIIITITPHGLFRSISLL